MSSTSDGRAAQPVLPLEAARRTRVLAGAERLETPFFGIDVAGVRARFEHFRRAWSMVFPRVEVAYSYKTNPLTAITRPLLALGACAEVVSGTELEWALADGAQPGRILFDGPLKSESELARALALGVQVQIDSVEEARTIARLLERGASRSTFRLRLATPRGSERWSRFGLFADEVLDAALLLERAGAPVSGLHLHVGSNVPDGQHALALAACGDIVRWFGEYAGPGFSLDIGGGYAASTAHGPTPSVSEYAASVATALRELGIDPSSLALFVEPGRCLVEEAGLLVTRVVSSKQRGPERIVVCDAGTGLVRSATSWRHGIYSASEAPAGEGVEFTLYGSNCFESDLLAPALACSHTPEAGDLLVIDACGAYDIASSAGWIRPRAPVLAWDGSHTFIARTRQSSRELRGCPDPTPLQQTRNDGSRLGGATLGEQP